METEKETRRINSPFAGIAAASLTRSANTYINDGVYHAEIQKIKKRISEHPTTNGDLLIIVELVILEVLVAKEYTTPAEGKSKKSNQVGEVCTTAIKMKWGETAIKMLKTLLCCAAGWSAEDAEGIDEDDWITFTEKACYFDGDVVAGYKEKETKKWDEQPLKGCKVRVLAKTKETTAGRDFTRVDFEPYPEDD